MSAAKYIGAAFVAQSTSVWAQLQSLGVGTDTFGSQPLDPATLAYNKPDFIDPVPVPSTNLDSMWGINNNLFAFNNQTNST